jgi:iron complex transport system substrate-binding protein
VAENSSFTKYATRFDVHDYGEYKLLNVFDPWQGSRGVTYTYVLGSGKERVPDSLAGYPFFRTPVSRVVTLSTTHVAMITTLGMAETIKGASGTGFIFDPQMADRYTEGRVKEVGYDLGLNYETIISLEPEVVFMFGVEGSVTATTEKLEEVGLKVVFSGIPRGPSAGKAEWIRFFAQFYGLDEESSGVQPD